MMYWESRHGNQLEIIKRTKKNKREELSIVHSSIQEDSVNTNDQIKSKQIRQRNVR